MKSLKKYLKYFILFTLGAVLMYFFIDYKKQKTTSESSHTIAYGIQRMSKMVVAEQQYANYYSYKNSTYLLDPSILSFDKNMMLLVKTRAQASYDLSKMDVEIDSVNQIIHIKKVPELEVQTFPDIEFLDVSQSTLNQFNKEDLNGIKKRAIATTQKKIDLTELENQAHEQLIFNLEEIYLLAKIYRWKVQDDTEYAEELLEKIKF